MTRPHHLRVLLARCAALAIVLAPPASRGSDADGGVIGVPLRVGATVGYQLTSPDLDVTGERTASVQPGSAPLFGLRVGLRLLELIELELAASVAPAPTAGGVGTAWLLPAHVDLVIRPTPGPARPYLSLGAGVIANLRAPSDVDALLFGALGVEVALGPHFALRVEVGVHATDAVDGALSFSPVFTLGLDVLAWRARRSPRVEEAGPILFTEPAAGPRDDEDPDGDGLTDEDDLCPLHAGPARHRGCPDSDGDGLADPFDRCPAAPGPRPLGGCPDRDRDGVSDRLDACPELPGRADRHGCP